MQNRARINALVRVMASISMAAIAPLLACLGKDPDPVNPSNVADSGANVDVAHVADSAADTDGAPTIDLLTNGDFELSGNCLGWKDYYSSIADEPIGHTGRSCRVCRGATADDYFFIAALDIDRALVPGEKYVASAWVRATDNVLPPSVGIVMEGTDSTAKTVNYEEGAKKTLSPTDWTQVTGLLTIGTAGVRLHLRIGASYAAKGTSCFLVDDATLSRL